MKSANELIEESNELLQIAQKIQDEAYPQTERERLLKKLDEKYHLWYRTALNLFEKYHQSGTRRLFEQEYAGSLFLGKIMKFLTSGLEPSPIYIQDNPLTTKWTYTFTMCFKEPFLKQCNLLASLEALPSVQATDEEALWNTTIRRIFTVFVQKAENAKTNNQKKLTYEYLAIFLIGAIEGLSVIGHDTIGASEEIDLWIANESTDGFWQRLGNVLIVECKNWGEPIGVQEVRSLKSIMDDKHVHFAILLSKNGITGDKWHDATDIIRKAVRNEIYIIVLDQSDLLNIAQGTHPSKKIKQKFYDLVMKS